MRDTCFTAFLCLAVAGCSDADADKLRKVGDRTYDRAANIVQQTWDELGRTLLDQQPASTEPDLLTKVQSRLKWERDLEGLPIVASVVGDVVTLSGTVKTKEQKAQAAKLVEGTVGVGKVSDELTVGEKDASPPIQQS
ncbi:MAG TPA: BON domain-containing protein [Gemmatales bacterium]|nr:BON domain-containing protein [Gemmatales bacterium]